jgi:hypothetical protein
MPREPELVWLLNDRHFAVLVNRGAFFSTVKYTRDGNDYEVEIENNDYEFYEDANDYECDG